MDPADTATAFIAPFVVVDTIRPHARSRQVARRVPGATAGLPVPFRPADDSILRDIGAPAPALRIAGGMPPAPTAPIGKAPGPASVGAGPAA